MAGLYTKETFIEMLENNSSLKANSKLVKKLVQKWIRQKRIATNTGESILVWLAEQEASKQ